MELSCLMWNRLEGATHNENQIENALRFEIRDALWMLTRQWQFGEFEGEDAGTAAFTRIETVQLKAGLAGKEGAPPRAFTIEDTPFEMAVESENRRPGLAIRLEMGRHWKRLLKKQLAGNRAEDVFRQFLQNKRFQFQKPEDGDIFHRFQHAQALSDERNVQALELYGDGRALDGYSLYRELRSGKRASLFLSAQDGAVDKAGEAFLSWYEKVYGQDPDITNTWHDQHLEYQPQFAFRNEENDAVKVLRKSEYYGDGIDWYGFGARASWDAEQHPTLPEHEVFRSAATVVPTPVRFRGMPSTRLWEMEDAEVDFGAIRAKSTELSKMLYAEFGLVYGNDWLLAPLRLPAGCLCRIAGMRVTDIFGKTSLLEEIKPDDNWAFLQSPDVAGNNTWLFTAPGSEAIQESQPIEKVLFMRDEMANLIWAVEETVADPIAGGRDGSQLARQLDQWLKSLVPAPLEAVEGRDSASGWVYQAGRPLAENRIPFIPVALQPDADQVFGKRQVVLRRAALPRILADIPPVRVRPRTTLLGAGSGTEADKLPPFFIFEEEVPREGANLELVWKRTRWFNGSTKVWLARKKTSGRGEVDANFSFDTLEKR